MLTEVGRPQIIGAPSFFPTIWGYINKWFEPSMTAKISVLAASEVTQTLLRYIDEKDLPQVYGGRLNWEYGMYPTLDQECQRLIKSLTLKWVDGPLRLTTDANGKGAIVTAVGTDAGKKMRDEIVSRISRPNDCSDDESD